MRRAALLLAAVASACEPDFGERESLVVDTQVLAVRGEPPEARPNEAVTYTVLVASPHGPVEQPAAAWAFCATPKLLTENGAVSRACLGDGVHPIADAAPVVTAPVPGDACILFGPETSSQDLRPRDPDVTGGFFQPVRVTVSGRVAFGLERIRCNLASAGADAAAELDRRYVPNRNPELLALGASVALDAVPRGARVVLRASWPSSAAESYVVLDPASQRVVDRRETLRVSWFATAGVFHNDRTGRAAEELETFTENAWDAPRAPGRHHLFVVLRDDRGGSAFGSYVVDVQ